MKYLIILIIASTCIGCAGTMSSYEGKGGPFTIQNRWEMNPTKYYILSIRDSGFVLAPDDNTTDEGFSHTNIRFLHRDSILSIQHSGLSGLNTWGAIGGMVVGGFAGLLIGDAPQSGDDPSNWVVSDQQARAMTYGLIGMPVGALIGGIIFAPQNKFDLSKPEDKEKLIALCKYCGHEPDFINAIK